MDYSFAFVMNDAVVVAATVVGFLESNGFDGKGLRIGCQKCSKKPRSACSVFSVVLCNQSGEIALTIITVRYRLNKQPAVIVALVIVLVGHVEDLSG